MRATRIIKTKNGDIKKFPITSLPLMYREFKREPGDNRQVRISQHMKNGATKGNFRDKDLSILKELKKNDRVNISVQVLLEIDVSEEIIRRQFTLVLPNVKIDKIQQEIDDAALRYVSSIPYKGFRIERQTITSTYSGQEFKLQDMKLRDSKPLNIEKYISNIDCKVRKDCVRDYLLEKYNGKISNKQISSIGNNSGCSISDIKDFCSKNKIGMIAYDINGNIISEHKPEKQNKNLQQLYYIAYNNHLYPLKSSKIEFNVNDLEIVPVIEKYTKEDKLKNDKVCVGQIKNLNNHLSNNLKNKKYCYNIQLDGYDVTSYCCENKQYINNSEYTECREILKKYGLESECKPYTNFINISNIIEKQYLKKHGSIDSFFPDSHKFYFGGYNYFNPELYLKTIKENIKLIKIIDNNKHYSDSLMTLPYLLKFDLRQCNMNKKPIKILETNMYIAKPKYSSILMEYTGLYPGYYLEYCRNKGIEFELLEEMECIKIPNFYKEFAEELSKKTTEAQFKDIMNRMIGNFCKEAKMKTSLKCTKICNIDELKRTSGYVISFGEKEFSLDDQYKLICEPIESFTVYTRKLVNLQVIFNSRKNVYEQMEKLKLNESNIIKIKTDAIYYIGDKYPKLGSKIGEWKKLNLEEERKKIDILFENDDNDTSHYNRKTHNDYVSDFDISLFEEPVNNESVLNLAYAGAGKSYEIKNKILKQDNIKNDYLLLTPSYSSLKEYKKDKLNCDVIHTYSFGLDWPKEKNIIIDEIGMVDRLGNDLIFKLFLAGKNIIGYGDYKQLPPVFDTGSYKLLKPFEDEPSFKSINFFNKIYGRIRSLTTNYRNNFTTDYYDSIIEEKVNIQQEVLKHSTQMEDAEFVICCTNETRKKYNEIIMKKLGINMWDIGMKIMCKKNLPKKNIYNNFIETIIDKKGDKYILSNGTTFSKSELVKYCVPAYSRTVYNIQGETIKSYHFAKEDIKYIKSGNIAYTIISRLKQDKIKNDLELNIFE